MKLIHKGELIKVFVDETKVEDPNLQLLVRKAGCVVEACLWTGEPKQFQKLCDTLNALSRESIAWLKAQNPDL